MDGERLENGREGEDDHLAILPEIPRIRRGSYESRSSDIVEAERKRSQSNENLRCEDGLLTPALAESASPSPRQSLSVDASPRVCRRESDLLTKSQKSLLRLSWQRTNKAGGPSGIGAMIFARIFDNCPPIRQLFGFGDISAAKLVYNKQFAKHARAFVDIINDTVNHLDHLNLFCGPKLMQVGRMHIRFETNGFKPKYWDVFAEAMTEAAMNWTPSGKHHRETIRAWTILVSYIIDKMRQGFEMEKRKQRRQLEEDQMACPHQNMQQEFGHMTVQ